MRLTRAPDQAAGTAEALGQLELATLAFTVRGKRAHVGELLPERRVFRSQCTFRCQCTFRSPCNWPRGCDGSVAGRRGR